MNYMRAIILAVCAILAFYEVGVNAAPSYYDPYYYGGYGGGPTYYKGGNEYTSIKNQNNCNNEQYGAGILPIGLQGVVSPCINSQE
ncbi:hypothetical protein JTE90_001227 [Oedothorax gibbosus]|uniref:Uncharacterized protein n=1 Tax=Oedothorax gibbosus TaxID=931172 RepID=A0AAV6UW16_9ARAC|nr:hypothetical protein JTE90_001227 [Oedothorax gibbosus]